MTFAVATVVKDEAPTIVEWMAHQLALGFDEVYVYDDGSTDGTRQILAEAAANCPGRIRVFDVKLPGTLIHQRQNAAFNDALFRARADGHAWMLACDADEFVVATAGTTITDLARRCDDHAAVGLFWAFYGSSGHERQPSSPLTESFRFRGTEAFPGSRHIKSFVRVEYVQGCWNAHAFSLDAQFPYVDASGEAISWSEDFGVIDRAPIFSPWRINHYFCQSRQRFARKLERARQAGSKREPAQFDVCDRNEVYDPVALAYADETQAWMDALSRARPALRPLGDVISPYLRAETLSDLGIGARTRSCERSGAPSDAALGAS